MAGRQLMGWMETGELARSMETEKKNAITTDFSEDTSSDDFLVRKVSHHVKWKKYFFQPKCKVNFYHEFKILSYLLPTCVRAIRV